GTFAPRGSLAETVAAMAKAAATEDPRFTRLRPDELPSLTISVSALGTPHLLEDRSRIEAGVHGLLVRKGWNRGVLLPKVAVEQGWDGQTFLKHACLKAGLPALAARDPELVVEVFEAEEFGEEQSP
ncbi:MAG: AmmeMemoRadiSam system protein A, partial [Anaeromyxobacteraceae bacterium]